MMRKLLKYSALLFVGMFCATSISGQNSLLYIDEDYNYKMGIELFEKEKYAQAQDFFEKVASYYGNEHTDVKADAEYYSALCAIELFNADAEYRIAQFIANYPESPRTRVAYFQMGVFQYRKRNYSLALHYFDKVWKQHLSDEQLHEFYFKKGYSYFKEQQFEKASKMFYELGSIDSKYSSPALYYYSHIAYTDGNYETALNGFNELKEDPTFSAVVPYYVIQIYYLQGKNEKVLEYGPELLEASETKREAEISRIVGQALYAKEQYAQALTYLETYKKEAETYSREDIYQLGYVYYRTGDYKQAVSTLSNITNVDDKLTQNAYFHMADCYLKMDKKEQARMAFQEASKLDFDQDIKEVSLLNYAKLSYELSYSPFNETITAFDNYISSYPKSIHHDEAYGYLVKVYLTSKNYKAALASLNKIKVKSPEMMAANQRVAFFRGLELFNNLQFKGALAAFEVSLNQKAFDKQMHSLAIYWKAEALYRLERYKESAEAYNDFLLTPGAYLLKEYNKTYYNMGYCFFKMKEYKQAVSWFRKYTDKEKEVNQVKRGDAFIRIGDCYFVSRQYIDAIEFYDEAIKLDTIDVDYALFQKGFSFGLIKQYQEKNNTLTQLLLDKPESAYAADALFERGRSYVVIDSVDNAIADFNQLIYDYPNSSYIKKTLLQLGLLYYGKDELEKALESYKKVVEGYPGTPAAKDALMGIKNIYVDMNQVDDYFTYAKNQGGVSSISFTEKDSLTYLAAEKVYMNGNWDKAKAMFTQYLNEFPSGKFSVNAHYYRGDSYLRDNMDDSALADFWYVVKKPKNIFTEESLLNTARLNQQKGNDSVAYNLFKRLENQAEVKANLLIARKGQMLTSFKSGNYENAIEAARRVLITDKVAEEDTRTARLIMGKSYKATNLYDAAITQFRILAQDVKNEEGAEGKYKVAQILFLQEKYDMAEQEVLDYINMGTPHQYWLAKSFLLLSDIYVLKEDRFQAKIYLQSVIDNYSNTEDGIIKEAEKRLDSIVTEENRQFKKENQEGLPEEGSVMPTDSTSNN